MDELNHSVSEHISNIASHKEGYDTLNNIGQDIYNNFVINCILILLFYVGWSLLSIFGIIYLFNQCVKLEFIYFNF